jgi:RNA recognition motif-containing protein
MLQVIRDKNSMRSRGFAFVSYSQPHFAAAAMQQMNGVVLYGNFRGRSLKVGPSNRVI